MVRFLLGFLLGLGLGAGVAMLLTPEPGRVARERLRLKADRYAGGEETPAGTVRGKVEEQRSRLEEAVEAGRRASAERQAELWAQLHLTPPSEGTSAAPTTPDVPKLSG